MKLFQCECSTNQHRDPSFTADRDSCRGVFGTICACSTCAQGAHWQTGKSHGPCVCPPSLALSVSRAACCVRRIRQASGATTPSSGRCAGTPGSCWMIFINWTTLPSHTHTQTHLLCTAPFPPSARPTSLHRHSGRRSALRLASPAAPSLPPSESRRQSRNNLKCPWRRVPLPAAPQRRGAPGHALS
jgi:hypothetical protein